MSGSGVATAEPSLEHGRTAVDDRCVRRALDAFRDMADAIDDEGDLESLLEVVTGRLCRLLSVRRCSVYLLDNESGLYRGKLLRVGNRVDDRVAQLACGVEADAFTREIVATKRPVLIPDAKSDPRPIRSTMLKWNVRALLGVPMVLRGVVIGVLYLDDEGDPHTFSTDDLEVAVQFAELAVIVVAHVRAQGELRSTLRTVARQNKALRQAAVADNKLAELALAGADLDEIAQSVAGLTRKPCSIYGADGRRIGSGLPPGATDVPGLLEPEDCTIPEIAGALAALRPAVTSVIGPFRAPGFAHRRLIAPVAVRGDEWGRLVLMEQGAALNAFDAAVARGAATIIALEISAQRRAAELDARTTETLVRDLISGLDDERALSRRARLHGFVLHDKHVMCLIRDDHAKPGQASPARAAAEAAAEAVGNGDVAVVADVPEGVVLLLRVPRGVIGEPVAWARGLVEDVLAELPDSHGCTAAISTSFSGMAGFARAYSEVRQVARCLRTFRRDANARLLSADELGAGCTFLASTSREEADQFVRHTLGPLVDQQNRSMRDLLTTLAVYFRSSGSARHTADRLGVHENTIRYRLAKIIELTGLDVATNADHQLAAQLATLVLRLEGTLPADEATVISAT